MGLFRLWRKAVKRAAAILLQIPARTWLLMQGVRAGSGLYLEGMVTTGAGEYVRLGRNVRLGKGVSLGAFDTGGELRVGDNTYIGKWTVILAYESVTIGNDCLIAPFCYIIDVNHGMVAGKPIRTQPLTSKPVRIGNDVWIGAGTTILPGVTIGDGAVIGTRAVVTKDISPNAIAVGVPARVIRMRT